MEKILNKIVLMVFLFYCLSVFSVYAQSSSFPDSSLTKWVIEVPEEVVSYLIFDPATVQDRIPSFLRFITIEELAFSNVSWAKDHLKTNPEHSDWGIGFIEIIRMDKFEIDGRSPVLPEHGAAAVWFARVDYKDSENNKIEGKPFLALDFWLPDSSYVTYMRNKGHYATYGNVTLFEDLNKNWQGSIDLEDLKISCRCRPEENISEIGSNAVQLIFPPAHSGITNFVVISVSGHKIKICEEGATWSFKGKHPLVKSIILGSTSFQYGYNLIGGSYKK